VTLFLGGLWFRSGVSGGCGTCWLQWLHCSELQSEEPAGNGVLTPGLRSGGRRRLCGDGTRFKSKRLSLEMLI
jgi:hypothetical protein